jgi:hypothetical protein
VGSELLRNLENLFSFSYDVGLGVQYFVRHLFYTEFSTKHRLNFVFLLDGRKRALPDICRYYAWLINKASGVRAEYSFLF